MIMEITCKDLQRFWNKVKKSNNCWLWIASVNYKGYGEFRFKKKLVKAHRFSYEISKGFIPKDMTIDHLCRNRACVNPEHLECVPMKENVLRGISFSAINSRKTHCKRGHEFTKENTIIRKLGRECRICKKMLDSIYGKSHRKQHNEINRRYYHRKRLKQNS